MSAFFQANAEFVLKVKWKHTVQLMKVVQASSVFGI
jgi:hypothetical protein